MSASEKKLDFDDDDVDNDEHNCGNDDGIPPCFRSVWHRNSVYFFKWKYFL